MGLLVSHHVSLLHHGLSFFLNLLGECSIGPMEWKIFRLWYSTSHRTLFRISEYVLPGIVSSLWFCWRLLVFHCCGMQWFFTHKKKKKHFSEACQRAARFCTLLHPKTWMQANTLSENVEVWELNSNQIMQRYELESSKDEPPSRKHRLDKTRTWDRPIWHCVRRERIWSPGHPCD